MKFFYSVGNIISPFLVDVAISPIIISIINSQIIQLAESNVSMIRNIAINAIV
jgi:hypothetical protein